MANDVSMVDVLVDVHGQTDDNGNDILDVLVLRISVYDMVVTRICNDGIHINMVLMKRLVVLHLIIVVNLVVILYDNVIHMVAVDAYLRTHYVASIRHIFRLQAMETA